MNYLTFVLSLLFVVFSSCEKEELVIDSTAQVALEKANQDCVLDAQEIPARIVNFCGTDYVFQASLRLMNNEHFHWVEGTAKCYKLGGHPDEVVDFASLEVIIDGTMSIDCEFPAYVQEPTVYNANLINGNEVPYYSECNDCGRTRALIEYKKNVTLREGELIKASYQLKMEGCGESFSTLITEFIEP